MDHVSLVLGLPGWHLFSVHQTRSSPSFLSLSPSKVSSPRDRRKQVACSEKLSLKMKQDNSPNRMRKLGLVGRLPHPGSLLGHSVCSRLSVPLGSVSTTQCGALMASTARGSVLWMRDTPALTPGSVVRPPGFSTRKTQKCSHGHISSVLLLALPQIPVGVHRQIPASWPAQASHPRGCASACPCSVQLVAAYCMSGLGRPWGHSGERGAFILGAETDINKERNK